ncbi:MAG TPA: hypothetical protein DDX19_20205 [Rhodopirellula baltica]|nr:hypothetical protein [Rhodopirellula baltica]
MQRTIPATMTMAIAERRMTALQRHTWTDGKETYKLGGTHSESNSTVLSSQSEHARHFGPRRVFIRHDR